MNIMLQVSKAEVVGYSSVHMWINEGRVTPESMRIRNADVTRFVTQLRPERIEIDSENISADVKEQLLRLKKIYLGMEIAEV